MSSEPQAVEMAPTCMHSVNRIVKLPVVDSTITTATNIYEKVKDYNSVTNWTLQTAEDTVSKAVQMGKPLAAPVFQNLEGPIKTVDGILCTGLDYVESKVPAVKLPPTEMYNSTKEYVSNTVTPVMETAKAYAEPAVQKAHEYVDPVVNSAKQTLEPKIEAAKNLVETNIEVAKQMVEPVLEKAQQVKDYGMHKVDEYLHRGHDDHGETVEECQECQEVKEKVERAEKEKRENQDH